MMNTLPALVVVVAVLTSSVAAVFGTDTFDSILVAHPSPTICPPASGDNSYLPDANYVACCNNWYGTYTLTTGLGPGSKPVYACCRSGYTCTAPVSLMKDWTIDTNGDLQTMDLASPPTPTAAPTPTQPAITPAPTASTGTSSRPGATPIATSAGVIVYVYNDNKNDNENNINIGGSGNTGGGSSPSAGAIAGITVACTVVTTIAAVLGLWYARKQARKREASSAAQTPTGDACGRGDAPMAPAKKSTSPSQYAELDGYGYPRR